MALGFVQVEEITELLRAVPRLVDRLEARRSDFFDGVLAWLHLVEKVLEANRLPAVSEVAAWRGLLLQASRGQPVRDIDIIGRSTRRKLRDASANHVLNLCNTLLHSLIRARLDIFAEGERLTGQIAAVARAKGYVDACRAGTDHAHALACVQQRVTADPDTAAAFVHLNGLVGRQDASILLDRALPELT